MGSEDSSSSHFWCSESGKERGFPMDSSSFVTSGPVCNALSVPCLIFMAEQKKKRNNFSMVTKIGVNGPSLGHWRPLNPTGKKGPWAVFFAT